MFVMYLKKVLCPGIMWPNKIYCNLKCWVLCFFLILVQSVYSNILAIIVCFLDYVELHSAIVVSNVNCYLHVDWKDLKLQHCT